MSETIELTVHQKAEGIAERQFFLDAAFIAQAFDMKEARVRALMDRKLFRSRVEEGRGDDMGFWRLTIRCGNRAWQGVVNERGVLQNQSMGLVPLHQVSGV